MKKYIFIFTTSILLACCFFSNTIYCYFFKDFLDSNFQTSFNITISNFDYIQCPCDLGGIIINQAFYDTYMAIQPNGEYTWKRDEYSNIVNREEIENLTKKGLFIKSDFCYEIMSDNYSLIYHGIPNYYNPLSWALKPVSLNYFIGWAYDTNRIVKTNDEQYFMARFYTTNNPLVNRAGWNKIEKPSKSDFYCYKNSTIPNYSKPILQNIVRAYIWDTYTTYLTNDIVFYNGYEYRALQSSNNKNPQTTFWAWELI